MAGKGKTKQRLITIIQYLREYGEEGVKIDIKHLQKYLGDLSSNRQILYNDLRALEELGAGIEHNKNGHYIYSPQGFTSGELMLLADVICCSSFLSAKKAEELISHIKQMTNMKRFDDLSQDIDVVLRNKTLNDDCIKNIESIHDAIRNGKKIRFSYAKLDTNGELWYIIRTENGYEKVSADTNEHIPLGDTLPRIYTVSPYKMVWDNSQCYLICGRKNDEGKVRIANFRADKIFNLSVTDEKNDNLDHANAFYDAEKNSLDAEKYLSSIFEMFGSKDDELTKVKFVVLKKLKGAMTDKFGKQTQFIEYDESHFSFSVQIQRSNTFFGWLAKYRYDELRILEPNELIIEFADHLKSVLTEYSIDDLRE